MINLSPYIAMQYCYALTVSACIARMLARYALCSCLGTILGARGGNVYDGSKYAGLYVRCVLAF